ncbi:unnamed protein product [Schistosoma mattheei]|uniref:Uncharacterized protein n=1 Tax=Schistosoma mattheei TaxID=31246 RepID=A0A183Q0X7_9TREM|nr:unnamed protein product [Schistosoma mattheei]
MSKEDDEDVSIVAHFLTFIRREAHGFLKSLALPEKLISLSYTTLKDILLDYVQYTNSECDKGGKFRKKIPEDGYSFFALRHLNLMHTHGYADNSFWSSDAVHEMPCKSEVNMLNEPGHARKPGVVLIDADFSNDPLLCNDIRNKFRVTIPKESTLDVLSNIICLHNSFVSCEIIVQCEAQVLNELEFDYNSDDFISTAVYPYHGITSNVYSSQCEKYV